MLPRPRRLAGPLALAGALGALFSAGAARAQVTVVPTVTSTGALFTYSYSVTNSSATDLAIVNIDNLPQVSSAVTNLVAPAGFQITFDPGNGSMPGFGIVSFLPVLGSAQGFTAGSTISGFSFNSAFTPGTVPFDTLDNNGTPFNGTTRGPSAGPAPVPEVSALVSLGTGLLMLTFCAARRRRAACSGTHS